MVHSRKTYDVFVSHAANDTKLAKDVAITCQASGLEAVTSAELLQDENASDGLWEALAESLAIVVILSPIGLTPSMGIEVGAGRAWEKPMFGILTDISMPHAPPGLSGIRLYPPGRIVDVIWAIKSSAAELSAQDRSLLANLYRKSGVPVDQLTLHPDELDELVKRFHEDTGKTVSGEHLLSEILRMRKRGHLPNGSTAKHSKPRKGTA